MRPEFPGIVQALVLLVSAVVLIVATPVVPPAAPAAFPLGPLTPGPSPGNVVQQVGPSYEPIVTEMGCPAIAILGGGPSTCYIGISWDHGTTDGTHGGPVNWTSTSPGGSFSPYPNNATPSSDCYIAAGQSGACVIYEEYVDTAVGTPTITASFDCGGTCPPVNGSATITIERVGTYVVCNPDPVDVGAAVVCTATVLGTSPPTGAVDWSSTSSTGQFNESACTLVRGPDGQNCSVTWTDSAPETGVTITASYQGDANNSDSSGTTTITVVQTVVTYPVTFQETGLPDGTPWSVTLATTTSSSVTDAITIAEPDFSQQSYGMYTYGIAEAGSGNARYLASVPSSHPGQSPVPCSDPTCGLVEVSNGPVTVLVIFGQTWQTDWIPSRDTYAFPNPGSIYSPHGNCYGISETEVLYWYNLVDGNTAYPYLPLQPTRTGATAGLTESQGWLSWSNGAYPPNTLNNASLAITLHQVLDPDNAGAVRSLLASTFNEAYEFNVLQADVAFPGGAPTVIAMGSPNPSGGNTYYHAVVVYGMTLYPNESWEFAISDPNVPSKASTGWYYAPNSTFYYDDGYLWRQFVPVTANRLGSSFINGQALWNQQNAFLIPAYDFVVSTTPVVIKTPPVYVLGHRLTFSDSFRDNGGGDSQTLYAGINGSVGIEEGSTQAYGIPYGTTYTVDPPALASSLLVMWEVNQSGSLLRYGFTVGTEAPGPGDYNLTPNADGFNLTASTALTIRNVSFSYGTSAGYALLRAYNLTLAAGSTARFRVTSWAGLNSSGSPSVTLEVYAQNSTTPSASYGLTNGENGLAPTMPGATPTGPAVAWTFPVHSLLYGGLAVVLVAVVVAIVLYRRRGGPKPSPPPRPSG
jgi:hypothetical protein